MRKGWSEHVWKVGEMEGLSRDVYTHIRETSLALIISKQNPTCGGKVGRGEDV